MMLVSLIFSVQNPTASSTKDDKRRRDRATGTDLRGDNQGLMQSNENRADRDT